MKKIDIEKLSKDESALIAILSLRTNESIWDKWDVLTFVLPDMLIIEAIHRNWGEIRISIGINGHCSCFQREPGSYIPFNPFKFVKLMKKLGYSPKKMETE